MLSWIIHRNLSLVNWLNLFHFVEIDRGAEVFWWNFWSRDLFIHFEQCSRTNEKLRSTRNVFSGKTLPRLENWNVKFVQRANERRVETKKTTGDWIKNGRNGWKRGTYSSSWEEERDSAGTIPSSSWGEEEGEGRTWWGWAGREDEEQEIYHQEEEMIQEQDISRQEKEIICEKFDYFNTGVVESASG